jgi:hypothetical protein
MQFENTREIDSLAQHALADGGLGAQATGDVLHRLGRTIQLMRLEHADAHLYRDGCDALVEQAIDGADGSGLRPALAQIMSLVERGDYHWALKELRMLAQPAGHAC